MNLFVNGWQDMPSADALDPKSFILNSLISGTQGVFTRSTNVLQSSWGASALTYNSGLTQVISLNSTDASTTVDASQWVFNHQMVNTGANIPASLQKVAFFRSGRIWDNQIGLSFGSSTFNNVQLTFRDNLGTSGQFLNSSTGGIPVINFGNGITGNQSLHLTFSKPGTYLMVLIMQTGATWSAFEMEWIVL